jgi:hypothetical protein
MLERRHAQRRKTVREGTDRRRPVEPVQVDALDSALEGLRFLSVEIKAYVSRYGRTSIAHFDRVIAEWYGPLEARTRLLEACQDDAAVAQAFSIVHAAGFRAAPLLPYILRRYFGERFIDERA